MFVGEKLLYLLHMLGANTNCYEGDSICNEIALITPPTYGFYYIRDERSFEWCIKLYSIILTYLHVVTDFEKGTLIYTVHIFIRIEKIF